MLKCLIIGGLLLSATVAFAQSTAVSCEDRLAVTDKMLRIVQSERDRIQEVLSRVLVDTDKKVAAQKSVEKEE